MYQKEIEITEKEYNKLNRLGRRMAKYKIKKSFKFFGKRKLSTDRTIK